MSDYKIPFTCGRIAWSEKPVGMEIAECQQIRHYQTVNATAEQILKLICEGRTWRAGIYKQGATRSRDIDFIGARLIALDFDVSEASPQDMVDYCVSRGVEPNFWYYSFRQGIKPKDNFRIVWVLDEVISVEEYEKLIIALMNDYVFNTADPTCKNIGRLWFGTRNGGGFIKNEPISFSAFDVFPREVEKKKGGKKKKKTDNSDTEDIEQSETAETFIIPSVDFNWNGALQGVCDLWDKWVNGKYLHYHQRLLLFSELKCLKYEAGSKRSLLNDVMRFYDADLYADSKCDRAEIKYFLTNPKVRASNKIVLFNGKEYTIAEWFNSGDYLERRSFTRKRITREQLKQEADEKIPRMLEEQGIQYIECQTEAGKTERIINYIAAQDLTQKKIIYSIPTYILIDEFIKRLLAKGIPLEYVFCPRKVDYTDDEIIYLDFGFPECVPVNEQMLERRKELAMVEDEEKKGLFILTHSALAHLKSINADQIIIDENIEDCLVDRYEISLAALGALGTYIYTKDEILKYAPRQIVLYGDTTEEKLAYLDSQLAEVNSDLQRLIAIVRDAEPQTVVDNIDIVRIVNYVNAYRLHKDKEIREILRNIGKLRNATIISVGENTYQDKRYLYFEISSKLLNITVEKNIKVSLLTGTPKLKQLEAGLSKELMGKIHVMNIERADPRGTVKQYLKVGKKGASGSKANIRETFEFAIRVLERENVDWQHINLLTLKSCVERAKKRGFHIPTTAEGEEIYIENCAGIDSMKGQDLIVIGKSDIPKNKYLDMIHDADINDTQKRQTRVIDDTGVEVYIYGFTNNELWGLQEEQIRLATEQAVGRARTLWEDCSVYLFCDFPVRNAEYITIRED